MRKEVGPDPEDVIVEAKARKRPCPAQRARVALSWWSRQRRVLRLRREFEDSL